MKTTNQYYGAGEITDNNSETDPDILDRVKALAPKPAKIKSVMPKDAIAAAKAMEKLINDPAPSQFKQSSPNYSPAAKAPGIKIAKQVKRAVVIPKQAKRSFKR